MDYDTFKSEVNDRINNTYFTDGNSNEVLRATNHALRDINIGKVAGKPIDQIDKRRLAYDFQREETDISYVSGTERYTLSTILTVIDLKWTQNILIDSDENRNFTKRTAEYFRRRRGVNVSVERNFADEYLNGVRSLLIYNAETDTLNLIWYSNFLVKSGGGTRAQYLPTSNNGSYENCCTFNS